VTFPESLLVSLFPGPSYVNEVFQAKVETVPAQRCSCVNW
jgi:hypothetical protein